MTTKSCSPSLSRQARSSVVENGRLSSIHNRHIYLQVLLYAITMGELTYVVTQSGRETTVPIDKLDRAKETCADLVNYKPKRK